MSDSALLNHFLQRLQKDITRIDSLIQAIYNDVHFLVESGQIDPEDAALILSKVPGLAGSNSPGSGEKYHGHGQQLQLQQQQQQQQQLSSSPPKHHHHSMGGRSRSNTANVLAADVDGLQLAPPSYPSLENVIHNVPRQHQQPPAPKRQARALWDYNLDLEELEDLSFEKGAIIEILREDNDDWWTGRVGGRTGIFPSNYAEVLHHPLPTWSTAPPPATVVTARPAKQQTESAPKYMPMPYKAVHHPENAPNPTGTRPQALHQQQQQHQDQEVQQENKYSHIKNTMANAAAGGIGFGAGAAIGGSVVRAIF